MTNEEFLTELFEKHYKKLYNFVNTLTKDKRFTEDILQETFIIACRKVDKLRNHTCPEGFLVETAKHETYRMLKKIQKEEQRLAPLMTQAIEVEMPESSIGLESLYKEFGEYITQSDIDFIDKIYRQGYIYKDLAKERGTTEYALKTHMCRLKKKLQKFKNFSEFVLLLICLLELNK